MGRTKRTQVALYLDPDKAEALQRLAKKQGCTQQDILRRAIDMMFGDYGWQRTRAADGQGDVLKLVKKSRRSK